MWPAVCSDPRIQKTGNIERGCASAGGGGAAPPACVDCMLLRAREYLNLVRRVLAAAALGEDFREVQTEPFELVIGPVLDPCPLRNFTRTSNEVDLAARTPLLAGICARS